MRTEHESAHSTRTNLISPEFMGYIMTLDTKFNMPVIGLSAVLLHIWTSSASITIVASRWKCLVARLRDTWIC